jgi:hypothetical protein
MNSQNATATNWREVQDALTPKQIAYLENWEQHPELPPRADGYADPSLHQGGLLFAAQEYAATNATAKHGLHLPMPAGAQCVDGWLHCGGDEYFRAFEGTTRTDGDV